MGFKGNSQRKIINFLLQPMLQLRIGLYNAAIGILFCSVLGAILYSRFAEFDEVIATLTGSDDAIKNLVGDYLASAGYVALGLAALFIVSSVVVSIYYTHKMVGPTIAFRRQIKAMKNGDFSQRVRLRHGDAFEELANELNDLADSLEKSKTEQGDKQASA